MEQQRCRQIKDMKRKAYKQHKIVNLEGKSKKKYWKVDSKVGPYISHLICHDTKKNMKAYPVDTSSDRN
jgi:hypothetical protein